jgi:hypothetical protein
LNIFLTSSRCLVLLPLLMLTCVYNYYRTAPDRQTEHHAGCLCVVLLTVLLVTQTFTGPLLCLCCASCAVFLVSARHSLSCVCLSISFLPTYLAICRLLVLILLRAHQNNKLRSWMRLFDNGGQGSYIYRYKHKYIVTHIRMHAQFRAKGHVRYPTRGAPLLSDLQYVIRKTRARHQGIGAEHAKCNSGEGRCLNSTPAHTHTHAFAHYRSL